MIHLAAAAAVLLSVQAQAQPAGTLQATPPAAQGPSAKVSPAHGGDTKCAACHTPEGWGDVKFVHERTGFPLTGKHAQVACRKCHVGDFKDPLSRSCAGCHRDVHGGYSGVQCASCHDTGSWKSRFDADAHRRTNFPLQGRHATLPCEQCHGDRRDRSFARPTVACWECHQADLATATGRGTDHTAFPGYPQLACLGCHGFWRWSPASFTGHSPCFPIDSGNHAGIACLSCHVTLPVPLVIGSCSSTPYPACLRCHQRDCATHPQVTGFQCTDERCYGCHPRGTVEGGGDLRLKGPAFRKVKP